GVFQLVDLFLELEGLLGSFVQVLLQLDGLLPEGMAERDEEDAKEGEASRQGPRNPEHPGVFRTGSRRRDWAGLGTLLAAIQGLKDALFQRSRACHLGQGGDQGAGRAAQLLYQQLQQEDQNA